MNSDRHYKPNDLVPRKPEGKGRPPKESETLRVLKVTIL